MISVASLISVPSANLTPRMTFGNWLSPFSLRRVLAAAMTSLNTIRWAVSGESAPFVRTFQCRTVEKTLSIGLVVRKCTQCSAGSEEAEADPGAEQ